MHWSDLAFAPDEIANEARDLTVGDGYGSMRFAAHQSANTSHQFVVAGSDSTSVSLVDVLPSSAWDGIGSSIVGGLISGAIVLIGLVITFRHEERNRRIDETQHRARECREAANRLIVAVHNARDGAVNSRGADAGDFALWPLRECLLLTQSVLGVFPSYRAAEAFYGRVVGYRDWARAYPPPRGEEQQTRATDHRRLLDDDGQRAIWLLQHKPDDARASTDDAPSSWTADPQLF